MPKIAIIKDRINYTNEDAYTTSDKLIDSITDWSEVSIEDLALLKEASYKCSSLAAFTIIERVDKEPEFILNTIEKYKEYVKKEYKKELKRKEEIEAKRKEKQAKKEAITLEQKKKLLAKLKEELENGQ